MGSGPESIESRERMVVDALGEDTFPSGKAKKGRDWSTGLIGSHRLSWTLAIQKNKDVESVVIRL